MGRRWGLALSLASGCGPQVELESVDGGNSSVDSTTSAATATGADSAADSVPGDPTMPPAVTTGEATTDQPPPFPDFGLPGLDTGSGCELQWPFEGCGVALQLADVAGDTPLGTFTASHAVFASETWCGGCIEQVNVARIIFVPDPALLVGVEPFAEIDGSLSLTTFEFEGPESTWVPGLATYTLGGETASSPAEFIIDVIPPAADLAEPYDGLDPATVVGEVIVQGAGWSVAGPFTAAYCPGANTYAICE